MKKQLLIVFMALGFLGYSNQEEIFAEANQAYSEQAFEEALKGYTELISEGWTSAALFYNTGNTYFRLNQIGKAILYYEKALKLTPNDPDILANLRLAESQRIDEFDVMPTPVLKRIYRTLLEVFSPTAWFGIALLLILLGSLALTLFLLSKSKSTLRFAIYLASGGLGLLFLTAGYFSLNEIKTNTYGVLTVPNTYVQSEPNGGEDLFIIHEGTKAKIEEEFSGWVKARFPDGKTGWLEQESLERI